jgi:class 3 adenylate cyclase
MTIQEWLRVETDHVTLAIVFSDIVDSTKLQREVGDQAYHSIRRAHFARARDCIKEWAGHEVKTAGDSFFVVFKTVVAAFNFAVSLHDDTGDPRLRIRAGVHVGAVRIEDNNDCYGTAVNFTQRIMSVAKSGGVALSRDAKSQVGFEKAPEHAKIKFTRHEVKLPSFEGSHQVFLTDTPGMRAARLERASKQSLASKVFFGSHNVD